MKYFLFTAVIALLLSGCSIIKTHRPVTPTANLLVEASSSEQTMTQLGAALPAMKPGDERELKLIAAKQLTENGFLAEAIELYSEAEAMTPRKRPLDLQMAPLLADAGRYSESIKRYQRLMKRDAKNADLVNNYAYTLMESGDAKAAEVEFRRAMAIDPNLENAATNLGMMLARQQRYDEALVVLSPRIGESAANHNIGVVAVESGDEVAAIRHFEKAASLSSSSKLTHEFLAKLKTPMEHQMAK